MKWAVGIVADQTYVWLMADGGDTVRHAEAHLHDTAAAAVDAGKAHCRGDEHGLIAANVAFGCACGWWFVEPVADVTAFVAREDTW